MARGNMRTAFIEAWLDLEIPVPEIQKRFHIGQKSLYRHVFVYGLPKRSLLQPAGRRQLRQMYCEDGQTVSEIATVLKCRKVEVMRALAFHGLLDKRHRPEHDEAPLAPEDESAEGTCSVEKILGQELKKVRQANGWTRRMLIQHMGAKMSIQTLASYELGTRQLSVARLFELCMPMNVLPADLITNVQRRVGANAPVRIQLDLQHVAADTRPELGPLRQWAETLLHQEKPPKTVVLEGLALGLLADLCGMPVDELEAILRSMSTHRAR
ncbi:XRE family transcriptional regulator [Amycolatopsis decaplanina DSM 44594]|uniref:XRE family transcriptional regulator n=2 Tax=Amycolatopsis decaplanina TaxID=208441 RepID=M2YUR7_9PSEU|nr:XRE family transcriptional regulator [Amycolatopsis decaplanina DSM 44594]